MRPFLISAAALLLPALVTAQGAAQKGSAEAVCERLSADLQKQTKAYNDARSELSSTAEYKAAREKRDTAAIRKMMAGLKQPDRAGLAREAIAASKKFEGDDRAVLLCWAATNAGDGDIVKSVVADLTENHLKSPKLEALMQDGMTVARGLGNDEAMAFLDKVAEGSPHAVTKAWALYWKGSMLGRGRNVPAEQKKQADELMAKAEKLAEGHWLADKIAGPRFKAENLQIGKVAPNIVGEDIDGVKFELEDYRGKVVVLDFWGFW